MTDLAYNPGLEHRGSRPRMMLVRAFLAQNLATGCAFGGFGVGVLALQEQFGTSRGVASLGLALVVLSMSGLGPAVAALIARIGLRKTMIGGALLSIAGYVVLAYAPSMHIAMVACGVLIGPGAALFGAIPPSILAGGWYPRERGRAVGIAYIPLFVTLIPLAGLSIIQHFGLSVLFLSMAGLHVLFLPLMFGIEEPPLDDNPADAGIDPAMNVNHPLREVLARPIFWAIMVGDGVLNAAAIAGSSHMLPIVVESGASQEAAALLLSVGGGASILGSLLSGVLCDRYGSAQTLALASFGFGASWTLLAFTGWLPAMALASLIMGACGAAVFPPISVLVTRVFGAAALPRVIGLLGVFTLPFTFGGPPAAGWLRDLAGNYLSVMITFAIACLVVAAKFFVMGRGVQRAPAFDR